MAWQSANVIYHRLSIESAEWDSTFKSLSACVFLWIFALLISYTNPVFKKQKQNMSSGASKKEIN